MADLEKCPLSSHGPIGVLRLCSVISSDNVQTLLKITEKLVEIHAGVVEWVTVLCVLYCTVSSVGEYLHAKHPVV